LVPYDENTMVGFGRQTTSFNQKLGLKIVIYDVTDVQNPIEATNFEVL